MPWYNPPTEWSEEGGVIKLRTLPKTDFWRKTHYGFIRNNGHFYYREISGDFVVEARFRGHYQDLYDQAGLMVRLSPEVWCKTGIEYVHGYAHLSAVVTRQVSDWSVTRLPAVPKETALRVSRIREALTIESQLPGNGWELLRLAYLTESPTLQVGLMAASPEGSGFAIEFEHWEIKAPPGGYQTEAAH